MEKSTFVIRQLAKFLDFGQDFFVTSNSVLFFVMILFYIPFCISPNYDYNKMQNIVLPQLSYELLN
jgi:hypothetical protein